LHNSKPSKSNVVDSQFLFVDYVHDTQAKALRTMPFVIMKTTERINNIKKLFNNTNVPMYDTNFYFTVDVGKCTSVNS